MAKAATLRAAARFAIALLCLGLGSYAAVLTVGRVPLAQRSGAFQSRAARSSTGGAPSTAAPAPLLSSHECAEGANDIQRVCTFHDIYMFNGSLYYVLPEQGGPWAGAPAPCGTASAGVPTFALPKIHLRWMLLDEVLPGSDWLARGTMRPISAERLTALAAGAPRGAFGDAVFWSTWSAQNYGHLLGEYFVTLHNTLCKYRGLCAYDRRQRIQTIDLFPLPLLPGKVEMAWAHWFHDALACITAAPYLHLRSEWVLGRLVHIQRGLIGLGSDCRGREYCADPKYGRSSIQPQQMASFRERMGSCLEFDASAPAATAPVQVMLVDRPYEEVRHLLNVKELVADLESAYAGVAKVSLQYMEGLSLREQAQLWSQVGVAIQLHGATISNWLFMPHNSVAVHIVPRPRPGHRHNTRFAVHWVADLRSVTNFTVVNLVNPSMMYMHVQMERLKRDPLWNSLNKRQKVAVLERDDFRGLPATTAIQGRRNWLLRGADLVVEPHLLRAAVDQALMQVFAKSGLPLPGGFAPQEPSTQDRAALDLLL